MEEAAAARRREPDPTKLSRSIEDCRSTDPDPAPRDELRCPLSELHPLVGMQLARSHAPGERPRGPQQTSSSASYGGK
jgi:hypothetical protein